MAVVLVVLVGLASFFLCLIQDHGVHGAKGRPWRILAGQSAAPRDGWGEGVLNIFNVQRVFRDNNSIS